jgi:PAS domain S-box-containing protein
LQPLTKAKNHSDKTAVRATGDEVVYRSLFESSPGLFVVLDPADYRIMAVSDSYLDMTMRKREELLGRIFFDAFPDDPQNPEASGTANLLASLHRVKTTLAKDVMGIQKHPIVNPDTGILEDRYWTPMHSPVLDSDGKLNLIIHSTEDVTDFIKAVDKPALDTADRGEVSVLIQARELKRLNEELSDSQQRLMAIFRDASLGIAATNLEGCLTDANEAYCRMLGYSLDELKKMNVLELTHPDDRTSNLNMRKELIAGKTPSFIYEKRYVTRSGAIIWTRISASLLRDAEGTITNLIAIAEDITAQKESEAALKQTRALERLGGRIARVGGWVAEDVDGERQVYWASEIFGIYEFTGTSPPPLEEMLDLCQPVSRLLLQRALADAAQKAIPFDLEIAVTTFQGTAKWLRIAGEPELDSDGTILRTIGAVQDITRQKAEQLRGQQLSSQLMATLENMGDGFYLLNRAWQFVFMNGQAEKILQVSRADMLGRDIWECFPNFKNSVAFAGFHNAMQAREEYRYEHFSYQLNNWISLSAYPTEDGLAVYFRVITPEKQLQAQIAESEFRLKHITGAALDVVWDIDLVNHTSWYNDGLRRKYGYDIGNEEIASSFWVERIHPDDAPRVFRTLDELLDSKRSEWTDRYRFRKADGKYIHFEDRGYIIRDENGKALRILGGSTDITKRLELEEQVLQTQRLESIGQLTGGIAHDFNNLLTVILGNAQLLQEQLQADSKLSMLTDIINIAASRGADLTRHLLAFSRKQALQPQTIEINQLLVSLKAMLSRTLGDNIIISYKPFPGLWPAFIDPNQLEVALLNLCINARDAMPLGGVVTLETSNVHLDQVFSLAHSEVDPGDYVVISISDTGTGIPPDIIDRVFEPFFTTKETGKGTGLGLSTVFGFIKQSSGHINIYSEPGRGTTIKIFLPRSHERIEEPESAAAARAIVGGDEVVLLVEDNELVRKFGQDQMRSLGYRVLEASDASAALSIMRKRDDIQLLFTDVVMPGMGGHELARQALLLKPDLKVLFTSGYTRDSIIQNGKLDRGVHLLEKPYTKAALAAKVREALEGVTPAEWPA